MVDFNMDVGEMLKKIFSKKKPPEEGGKDSPKQISDKIQSKTTVMIAGAIGIIIIVLSIYFFIFRPKLIEQRKRIETKLNYEKELVETQIKIKERKKHLEKINIKFKDKMKLFHTNAEVEELYETISTIALEYKLKVSKLERGKEEPVYANNVKENNNQNKGPISYYKILVKYQVVGNYLFYMKFKKELAEMEKIINFENEEITIIPEKKGQISADGIISVARLPS